MLGSNFIILERNDKFETGRKFLKIAGFKDNFLKSGFTSAVLGDDGNIPEVGKALTISVITCDLFCKIEDV